MRLAQILPINDELRTVQGFVESFHAYDTLTTHPLFPPVAIALILLVLLFSVPRIRMSVWTYLKAYTIYLLGTWGRYKMRKERMEQQRARLEEVLVDHIEGEVEQHEKAPQEHKSKYMSPLEAKDWYRAYAKIHPTFINALKAPNLRAAIHERRMSEPRDANGKIIPIKFPDSKKEEPVTAQPVMTAHAI